MSSLIESIESSNSVIDFLSEKHAKYIRKISSDNSSFEYLVTQHLRMSGVYWGLTAMHLLGLNLKEESYPVDKDSIVNWIMSCFDPESGGFGGNTNHDPHILYTLSAVQILSLYDELSIIDKNKVKSYVCSLQQSDGSFAGDKWGEIDTRFSYCALSILSIIGELDSNCINKAQAIQFIASCKNFDGGFGAVPGAESHAGQIFCCVGALSIAGGLKEVDEDLLGWWLCERQCDSGGLNGRPEKQADVCYSWWILSTLSILGRTSWIDCDKLIQFILKCQDSEDGGIADRPGNMSDIFHTFFGICGLSLMKYFDNNNKYISFKSIDPTYALPKEIVQKMGLYSQTLEELKESN